MSAEIDLTGSVAIVTGGGRGIGRAIAVGLANRGAQVAVTARSEDEIEETVSIIERSGGMATAVAADIASPDDVDRLVSEVTQRFGVVDVLVNNAANVGPIEPVWDCDPDEWWQCFEVNVRGSLLCTRAVLPGMMAERRGRIISVVSGYGLKPTPYFSAYASAKASAMRLIDTVAAEVADHGITAFAVCPGTVRTAMTEHMLASPSLQRLVPDYQTGAPTRFRPPEDTADLVEFLASGRADRLTGCVIDVGQDDISGLVARADEIQSGQLYSMRLWKT